MFFREIQYYETNSRIGSLWLPIQESFIFILWQGLRVQPRVSLQMDRQLALRFRGDFSITSLCSRTVGPQRPFTRLVRRNALDQAFQTLAPSIPQNHHAASRTPGPGHHGQANHSQFRHDGNFDCHDNGHAMRPIAALPVLRLHCVEHAVFAVESRFPPHCPICALGRPRMGMERVSQYTNEFGDRRRSVGHHGRRRMVGNPERVRGRAQGRD
jgi:hypothetical protein